MNQSQATPNPTLFTNTEAGTTNSLTNPSGAANSSPQTSAKRGPSKQYIPVYRVELVRERTIKVEPRRAIHNSDDVVAILKDDLLKADRERLVSVMLNTKNVVIGLETVSIGTLSSSLAAPREIFKSAIILGSAAIILGHNHPSGDPTPSHEDARMTERISKAGEILGIKLLDHVIIAYLGSFSFRNAGRLP